MGETPKTMFYSQSESSDLFAIANRAAEETSQVRLWAASAAVGKGETAAPDI